MVVFSKENNRIYHQFDILFTWKFFWLFRAIPNMISPEIIKRMPAKSILLPVIGVVIPNSWKPNLIRGYAHPHAMAAVSAKITTHNGRWNMLLLFVSIGLIFRFCKDNQ